MQRIRKDKKKSEGGAGWDGGRENQRRWEGNGETNKWGGGENREKQGLDINNIWKINKGE